MKAALILSLCLVFVLVNASVPSEQVKAFKDVFLSLPKDKQIRIEKVLQRLKRVKESGNCDDHFCHDPDCGKNVTQLIQEKGYPCEEHRALTSDGYWLSMQRIPHGKNDNKVGGKPIVLLQHGLEDASHTWVINSAQESLGFILADEGFDVWLGNNRGNAYSNSNQFYSTSSSKFWEFSWDEMGDIDLPTQIEYALGFTGQKTLSYVGHSEGTTQAFSGFENATLAAKIDLFVALAPVAYVAHCESLFLNTLAFDHVDTLLETLGFNSFLKQTCWLDTLLDGVCDFDNAALCQVGMCVVAGCNPDNLNATRYDVYADLDPSGTSVQNINHWAQMLRAGTFCKYDYLTRHDNEEHYGQSNPPCYDLSQMAAPVAIFAGGKDKLGDPEDVSTLLSQLKPDVVKFSTTIDYYEHMDFVWGMDAHTVIYPEVVGLLKQYSSN